MIDRDLATLGAPKRAVARCSRRSTILAEAAPQLDDITLACPAAAARSAETQARNVDRIEAAMPEQTALLSGRAADPQTWIGLPVTAIAASLTASEWVGWAWQV